MPSKNLNTTPTFKAVFGRSLPPTSPTLPGHPLSSPSLHSSTQSGHSPNRPRRTIAHCRDNSNKRVIGILDVHILSALPLNDLVPFGSPHVYTKIIFGNHVNQAFLQTRVIEGGQIDQKLQVAISQEVNEVRIELWMVNQNHGSLSDKLLGFMSTMFPSEGGGKRRRYNLPLLETRDAEAVRGEVDVVLSYRSNPRAALSLDANPIPTPIPCQVNASGSDPKRRASESRAEQLSQPKMLDLDLAEALQILVEQRASEYLASLNQDQPQKPSALSNGSNPSEPGLAKDGLNRANWERDNSDFLVSDPSYSSSISELESILTEEDFEEVSQHPFSRSRRASEGVRCNLQPSSSRPCSSSSNIFSNNVLVPIAEATTPLAKCEVPGSGSNLRGNLTKASGKGSGKKRSYLDMKEGDYYLKCAFSREILTSQTKMAEFKRELLPRLIQNQEKSKKVAILSLQQQFELQQLRTQCPMALMGSA